MIALVKWHMKLSKDIIIEEQKWYYLTPHKPGGKIVHTFSKGISRKGNIVARFQLELVNVWGCSPVD